MNDDNDDDDDDDDILLFSFVDDHIFNDLWSQRCDIIVCAAIHFLSPSRLTFYLSVGSSAICKHIQLRTIYMNILYIMVSSKSFFLISTTILGAINIFQ